MMCTEQEQEQEAQQMATTTTTMGLKMHVHLESQYVFFLFLNVSIFILAHPPLLLQLVQVLHFNKYIYALSVWNHLKNTQYTYFHFFWLSGEKSFLTCAT